VTSTSSRRAGEPEEFLCRAEAAQRLQGRDLLRSRRVAADAGRESNFFILQNSELGQTFRIDNTFVQA